LPFFALSDQSLDANSLPGWYGKLPVLGDFASRRLDQNFLEAWDGWLAAGLSALRERLPDSWLSAYLDSPSWRFMLLPGVIGGASSNQIWAGVLMPSVDRVGRYFPFTIAQPLGVDYLSRQQMAAVWHWLSRLDNLAASAMHADWTIDKLEGELASLKRPDLNMLAKPLADGGLFAAPIWSLDHPDLNPEQWIDDEALTLWSERARGFSYWFASADHRAPRLIRARGLPDASAMGLMFGGPSGAP